jgi:hypothetical protein
MSRVATAVRDIFRTPNWRRFFSDCKVHRYYAARACIRRLFLGEMVPPRITPRVAVGRSNERDRGYAVALVSPTLSVSTAGVVTVAIVILAAGTE